MLVDPITLVDEFDTWHFDHLHGLFEFNLLPVDNITFPRRWQLTTDAELLIRMDTVDFDERQISIDQVRSP